MISKTHILFSLILLSSFSLNAIHVLCIAPAPAPAPAPTSASESQFISCGSSPDGETDSYGRKWATDSKFLTSSDNTKSATTDYQDPALPSKVPYMTTRLINSATSYKFSVSSSQRLLLRFQFYPSVYESLENTKAVFDVTANGLTLLRHFSPFITALALTQAYIIREYSLVPVPSGSLTITFTPSSSKHENFFAFVNSIEIIPMEDTFKPADLLGFRGQSIDVKESSLQTMHRLNVGGGYIPPINDSELARTWLDDSPYLLNAAFGASYFDGVFLGVAIEADDNVTVKYTNDVPEFVAPLSVYRTARSMGPDPRVNEKYNLTWVFQVDANFTYLVRFHFCEFQSTKANERSFDIYLNNQTAEETADVIQWAGSIGMPIYKDYAIHINDKEGDEMLWVALHPNLGQHPQYYDAILNGLEIFKVNDTHGNLAGPNIVPSKMLLNADAAARSFMPNLL
ncbi:hypothetical protein ACE6H2_001123 [Prunus campanulata]